MTYDTVNDAVMMKSDGAGSPAGNGAADRSVGDGPTMILQFFCLVGVLFGLPLLLRRTARMRGGAKMRE